MVHLEHLEPSLKKTLVVALGGFLIGKIIYTKSLINTILL